MAILELHFVATCATKTASVSVIFRSVFESLVHSFFWVEEIVQYSHRFQLLINFSLRSVFQLEFPAQI